MTKTMTRKELYDLVWVKPMTKASQELGLSDVGLKKICIKHEIPTPKMGHWAKKAHGKKVKQISLPSPSDPRLDQVEIIGSHFSRLSTELKAKISSIEKVDSPAETNQEIPINKIISRTINKLEKKKADKAGIISLKAPLHVSCSIHENSRARLIGFLEAFHVAIYLTGIELIANEEDTVLQFDGERLPFIITENFDKHPHEITEQEQKQLERWQQKTRSGNWYSYLDRPNIPEWDYFPSGKLVFKIEYNGYDGLRRTFSDAKIQTLESVLPNIIEGIQACAISKKHAREKRDAQEKEWERQRIERENAQQLQALEDKRAVSLNKHLSSWQHAHQLREFLAAWEQKQVSHNGLTPEETEWLNWAKAFVERIDPTNDNIPKLLQLSDFSPWELRGRY